MSETDGSAVLRVAVVEDHPMMRDALKTILARAEMEVVASESTAAAAYEAIGSVAPDVAVIDIGLPDESGVALTLRLLRRDSRLAVVIYTGNSDAVALQDALGSGARGFAFKTAEPGALLTAVRAAAAGSTFVAPELREVIARSEGAERHRRLSVREREVLALVADGRSNEQIGAELMLSVETVRTHIRNAMRKFGAHTRAHAVVEALRAREIGL